MNKDKIYGEMGITVPNDNIICHNCKHRAPDIQINGALTVVGYKKGECEKYGDKPYEILFKNGKCKYYEKVE